LTKEGDDDLDKLPSIDIGATPRRSISSLGGAKCSKTSRPPHTVWLRCCGRREHRCTSLDWGIRNPFVSVGSFGRVGYRRRPHLGPICRLTSWPNVDARPSYQCFPLCCAGGFVLLGSAPPLAACLCDWRRNLVRILSQMSFRSLSGDRWAVIGDVLVAPPYSVRAIAR
jgi:hypothetical protein